MRHRIVVAGIGLALATSGIAIAGALADAPPELVDLPAAAEDAPGLAGVLPASEAAGEGGGGTHGGPIDRFHEASDCDLVDLGGLPGNWTHGDYVAAVAGLGDPALVPLAAKSDCGKPLVAVEKGSGPPEHALERKAEAGSGGGPPAGSSVPSEVGAPSGAGVPAAPAGPAAVPVPDGS